MGSVVSVGARWYQTGTVTVAVGNTKVTGANTKWATAGLKPGDIFTTDRSVFYEIASIESDTSLTLAQAYAGPAQSAIAYFIIRNFAVTTTAEMASNVTHLVNKYENVIDSIPTVANTLTSTSTTDALSAAMGKALDAKFRNYAPLAPSTERNVYTAPDGNDATGDGTEAKPFKTLAKALSLFNGYTYESFFIKMKAGLYVEQPLDIMNRGTGILTITSASGEKDVIIKPSNNSPRLDFYTFWRFLSPVVIAKIAFEADMPNLFTRSVLHFSMNPCVVLTDCHVKGEPNIPWGLHVTRGAVSVTNCTISSVKHAISIEYSTGFVSNSTSTDCLYAVKSDRSLVTLSGAGMVGSTANIVKANSGQVFTQ